MAVAPDLLLQSAPEVKPRKSAARPPAGAQPPRKNEASSFAQVYAKERQTNAVERHEAAAKSARNKSDAASDAAPAEALPGAEAAVVADSGNDLPVDCEVATPGAETLEAELDPLLLFGMTGQVPLTPEETALALDGAAARAGKGAAGVGDSDDPDRRL